MERRIHFKRITAGNVIAVCRLSNTLSSTHRMMVADNAISIAQAYCSEQAWTRAIYVDETPVGFLMLHYGSDYEDGIDCPGAFLWRLMFATPYQGMGYGKEALDFLVEHLKAQGYHELFTSCEIGEGSPMGFYQKYGFEPTGDFYDEEPELVYRFSEVDSNGSNLI
jgi:diamine N-acetyltransferase